MFCMRWMTTNTSPNLHPPGWVPILEVPHQGSFFDQLRRSLDCLTLATRGDCKLCKAKSFLKHTKSQSYRWLKMKTQVVPPAIQRNHATCHGPPHRSKRQFKDRGIVQLRQETTRRLLHRAPLPAGDTNEMASAENTCRSMGWFIDVNSAVAVQIS